VWGVVSRVTGVQTKKKKNKETNRCQSPLLLAGPLHPTQRVVLLLTSNWVVFRLLVAWNNGTGHFETPVPVLLQSAELL
jgi:hypothetical protein